MKGFNRFSSLSLCAAVVMAMALVIATSPSLKAQDASAPAADDKHNGGEVVGTGTRVAARTRLESLAPVDVVSEAALASRGTTELAEALSTVAPSLNFPRPSITD